MLALHCQSRNPCIFHTPLLPTDESLGVFYWFLFVCLVVSKCAILHIMVLLSSSQSSSLFLCDDWELQFFWLDASYKLNGSKLAFLGRLLTIILDGIISKVGLAGISLISCFRSFLLKVRIC